MCGPNGTAISSRPTFGPPFIFGSRTRQGKRTITMKKPVARPDGLLIPRGESFDYCLGAYAEHQPFTLTALPGNNWHGPQAAPAAP